MLHHLSRKERRKCLEIRKHEKNSLLAEGKDHSILQLHEKLLSGRKKIISSTCSWWKEQVVTASKVKH